MSTTLPTPVLNQRVYPGVGDSDDCAVVTTFHAARAAGFRGALPTVPQFRAAAGNPDDPARPDGLTNDQVWAGVCGTVLDSLDGVKTRPASLPLPPDGVPGTWSTFMAYLERGWVASVGLTSSRLPSEYRYGFLSGHRVSAQLINGRLFVANPLAANGSTPDVMPEAILREAVLVHGGGWVLAVLFPQVEDRMVTITLTRLDPPRTFRIRAGTTVRGFIPTSSKPVKVETWVTASSARADATAIIVQGPDAGLVPHGAFVRALDGAYAGLYIPAGEVTLDAAPPTDTKHKVAVLVDGVTQWSGDV